MAGSRGGGPLCAVRHSRSCQTASCRCSPTSSSLSLHGSENSSRATGNDSAVSNPDLITAGAYANWLVPISAVWCSYAMNRAVSLCA